MTKASPSATRRSPIRLVVALLVTIFAVEFTIMAALQGLGSMPGWAESVIDASVLVAALVPVLFFAVLRPLERHVDELERAESALRSMRDELEVRVQARTTELEQRTREISLLAGMGEFLQACASAEEAHGVITRTAQQLFPQSSGALYTYSASRNDLEVVASWGDAPSPDERLMAPGDCWALRRGRPHRLDESRDDLRCRHVAEPGPRFYLCVPMIAQGDVLGLLHLRANAVAPLSAGAADQIDQRLAVTLAEHVALALMNLRLRETLRSQSIRDPLTGLFNRRYMEETLEREVRRAERSGRPLGVVMLDLDHFKRFNDAHGHDAGDALLRELGALLIAHVRGGDVACRYGGEEFTLILPEAPLDAACERVEALRLRVKELHLRARGQLLGTVTLSAGVAMFPDDGGTAEALLRAADHSLYRAKAEGRDRLVAPPRPSAA